MNSLFIFYSQVMTVMNIDNSKASGTFLKKKHFFIAVTYVVLPGRVSSVLCGTAQASYRYGLATDKYQNLFLYVTWLKDKIRDPPTEWRFMARKNSDERFSP